MREYTRLWATREFGPEHAEEYHPEEDRQSGMTATVVGARDVQQPAVQMVCMQFHLPRRTSRRTPQGGDG